MLFKRKTYIEKLISADGNGMIKIVTGIRRCGKSFLLFNLFKQHLLDTGVAEENAPLGVKAGVAAGIYTIAINSGPLPDSILLNEGADVLYHNMGELLAVL